MKDLANLSFVSCHGTAASLTCAAGPLLEVCRFYTYSDIPAGDLHTAQIGEYIIRDASGRYERITATDYTARFSASVIAPPTTLASGSHTATTVALTWVAGDATADVMEIWMATGAGVSIFQTTVPIGTLAYTQTGLVTVTAYHFKIRSSKYGVRNVKSAFTTVLDVTTS